MKEQPNKIHKNFSYISLLVGQTVSEFGGAIGALCNSLLLYEITGSKAAMGTLWLTYFIPSLILQFFIGPFIDRISRKQIMFVSQFLRGIVFMLPFSLMLFDQAHPWSLFVIQLTLGMIQPLYVPASLAILPTLISKQQLTQANAFLDGVLRLMGFLAPPLGGLLISIIGVKWTYLLVGCLFFLSALSLMKLNEKPVKNFTSKEPWLKLIAKGYVYFFSNKQLLWLGILTAFVQFAVGATIVINVPYIIDELNGNSFIYGLFMAGYPLGYFFGSMLVSKFQKFAQKNYIMLLGLLMGGASFVLLGAIHYYPLAIVVEILSGLFFPFFGAQSVALYQKTVPNELVGQIFSVRLLIIRSTMPLGILFAGQLGDIIGVRYIYIIVGGLICLVASITLVFPYFRFLGNQTLINSNNTLEK